MTARATYLVEVAARNGIALECGRNHLGDFSFLKLSPNGQRKASSPITAYICALNVCHKTETTRSVWLSSNLQLLLLRNTQITISS
ncbi:MAG: hypothetical protein GXP06_04980 [Alphaproteobacteria bacterium]|nr:hypothetical protein [Alphaproteobacteria bacterium]